MYEKVETFFEENKTVLLADPFEPHTQKFVTANPQGILEAISQQNTDESVKLIVYLLFYNIL